MKVSLNVMFCLVDSYGSRYGFWNVIVIFGCGFCSSVLLMDMVLDCGCLSLVSVCSRFDLLVLFGLINVMILLCLIDSDMLVSMVVCGLLL